MASSTQSGTPAFSAPELNELRHTLVTACHILDREGITDGHGHVSARVPGTTTFFTIANVSPGLASVDRLILMDCDGKFLRGAKTPPNEWPIHACVFKARPDVMSRATPRSDHAANGAPLQCLDHRRLRPPRKCSIGAK